MIDSFMVTVIILLVSNLICTMLGLVLLADNRMRLRTLNAKFNAYIRALSRHLEWEE